MKEQPAVQAYVVRLKTEQALPLGDPLSVPLLRLMAATNDVRQLPMAQRYPTLRRRAGWSQAGGAKGQALGAAASSGPRSGRPSRLAVNAALLSR